MREERWTRELRLPLGPRALASPRAGLLLAASCVVCAIGVAVTPWGGGPWLRSAMVVALVALAGALHHSQSRPRRLAKAWLLVNERGMRRVDGMSADTMLVEWCEPFGATVLASPDRARLLLALTSPRAMRYLSVRVLDAEDAASAPMLLAHASTAPEGDLRSEDEVVLSAADAERVLGALRQWAPGSLERAYLSDANGEPVVLDGVDLRVGQRRIDLSAPLEWRAFLYQELGAQAVSVCQATWVRQGDSEVVLVAQMPADGTWLRGADDAVRATTVAGTVQRCVARDARLMQASVGEPPPRELRRAIDRLFMLPLRRALDGAPRVSRFPAPVSRTMPEGRA